ncbi:hypothetical protein D3C74_459830 [compost metagenome]
MLQCFRKGHLVLPGKRVLPWHDQLQLIPHDRFNHHIRMGYRCLDQAEIQLMLVNLLQQLRGIHDLHHD